MNHELAELYGEPSIQKVAKAGRIRWAGHVSTMPDNYPAKVVFAGLSNLNNSSKFRDVGDDQINPQRVAPRVRRINRVNSEAPSLTKFKAAIKSIKSNKETVIHCITAEMLKADPTLSAHMLHHLFSDIYETATFPADWMQRILVKVPKKGDLTE